MSLNRDGVRAYVAATIVQGRTVADRLVELELQLVDSMPRGPMYRRRLEHWRNLQDDVIAGLILLEHWVAKDREDALVARNLAEGPAS